MRPEIGSGGRLRRCLRSFLNGAFAIAAVAAPLVMFPVSGLAAETAPPAAESTQAAVAEPTEAEQDCFDCHASASKKKTLADGYVLSLQVPKEPYLKSVHRAKGCAGCHADIDIDQHPPKNNPKVIENKRTYSLESAQVCRKCHAKKFEQWTTSIHAALVRSGSPKAPVCTDCHNPHAVIEGAASQVDTVPCKKCHADIFKAYLGSMHAKSRLGDSDSDAPVCAGCHSAHSVKPISAGAMGLGPVRACLGCHPKAPEKHANWLPNVPLHFETVTCPVCHSPNAERRVDLMLVNSKGVAHGTDKVGVPLFEASADSNGKGIDAQRLWTLMQGLDRSGIAPNAVLRGRLDVANGVQAHQMAEKGKALSDCHVCHQSGSQAFQSVTVSLVGPEGLRVGYGANPDVLNSAFSVDSVRGFYAIGGTRIKILDILLALAVISGLGVAFGHIFVGWMFKRFGFYNPHNGRNHPPAGGDTPKAAG